MPVLGHRYIHQGNWPIWAFVLSGALLAGAYGFEHIGGLVPCQMCHWQRHAHRAVLGVAALAILLGFVVKSKSLNQVLLLLIGGAFFVSFGLALWHMGVEYKWWDGPKSCAAPPQGADITPKEIIKALTSGGKMPLCSDAPWHLFDLSMAAYNMIASGLAGLVSFGFGVRRR